jgi:hypothetical protein
MTMTTGQLLFEKELLVKAIQKAIKDLKRKNSDGSIALEHLEKALEETNN